MRTIGLFFGSFNPIHIGHLALANWICEQGYVGEVWFIVSPQNPFKSRSDIACETLRLEWVREAIKPYSKFVASDIEFSLPRPSYTIQTLDQLRRIFPEFAFKPIIGSDNWMGFMQWKSAQRIVNEFGLLIYPRKEYSLTANELPLSVQLIEAPLIEVSSTLIRQSISQGLELPFFVSECNYKSIKQTYGK